MELEQLIEERKDLLQELRVCTALRRVLKHIEIYNESNIQWDEVVVVSRENMPPQFEEINENSVTNEINRLYDRAILLSEEINQIKDKITAEKR